MKLGDFSRWMTTVVAATALLVLTPVLALAANGVPGADDTSFPTATNLQAIDRVAGESHVRGVVPAGEDEINSDGAGQPPDMDDQGTDNPPDTEDDYDGEDYYAALNGGIVYGPGQWYGPDGWFVASCRWDARRISRPDIP